MKEFFQLDKRWYLLALVCHKDIFGRGCLQIFHHQCEAYYKALVTGSSEMSHGKKNVIISDVRAQGISDDSEHVCCFDLL